MRSSQVPASERYRSIHEIARGGMGRVLEAVDVKLERTVAIKEVLDRHPEVLARFEREVEITARLEHPSIVPLYDADVTADGTPFYVMRKVSGDPLDALIREAHTLDQRLTLLPNILAVANAVAHAHSRGVIHRDLKPSNVLVGELGETIVIDWGLAKFIGDDDLTPQQHTESERGAGESLHTVAGTVFGTPGFMAPEQVSGDEADARADVYALGACLYHVLAGKRPFHGLGEAEIFQRTLAESPSPLPTGVAPDLVSIVEKAMARDRSKRYLDAGGLVEDLRRFLGGQLVASHHYPVSARIMRGLRRHRAVVAAITIALTALILVSAISVRRIISERTRAEAAAVREHERSEDLIVAQAYAYLETNPTLAAASLQQLPAESSWWPRLGATVADIRARGVAYAYPIGGTPVSWVEYSPDDSDRILTSGRGVWLHDLVRRQSRSLWASRDVTKADWISPQLVVILQQGDDKLVDPETGAHRSAPWGDSRALTSDRLGTTIALGKSGQLVAYPLVNGWPGAPQPLSIALQEPAATIELGSHGRWLAVVTDKRVHLLRRADAGLAFEEVRVIEGAKPQIAFDDGEHRCAIVDSTGTGVELDLDAAATTRSQWQGGSWGIPRYAGVELLVTGVGTVETLRDGKRSPPTSLRSPHGVAGVGGAVARVESDSRIVVAAGAERYGIRTPYPVDMLAARPGRRFLIGITHAKMLVWNVEELLSTRSNVPSGVSLISAGDRGLFAGTSLSSDRLFRYDVATDQLTVRLRGAAKTPFDSYVSVYLDGTVILENQRTSLWVIAEPVSVQIQGIPGITQVRPLDDHAVVVSTESGAIHRVDRKTGRSTEVIATLTAKITNLASRNGWLVAKSTDGTLWRRDPGGQIARSSSTEAPDLLGADGTVYLTSETAVLAWKVGQPLEVMATLPAGSHPRVLHVTERYAVLDMGDRSVQRLDRLTRTLQTLLAPADQLRQASNSPRAAALVNGGISIVDFETAQSWRVVEGLAVQQDGVSLSPDGSILYAAEPYDDAAVIHAWQLGVESPRAWIMQATNARPPTTTQQTIDWSAPVMP